MKLTLKNGDPLEVRPLSASKMDKFFDRLEENRTFSDENKDKVWAILRRQMELAADMISEATDNQFTPEQVKELIPHHEANDWVVYLVHGQNALEKKRAAEKTVPTTIS